jgi:rod shape-determining protein MreB and related proteins
MLNKFFSFFSHDIGIDLGTANTLIWVKGKGIVIREPSVVAIQKKTKKVIAIGTEAKKMVGKTPQTIITVRPLRGGIIADYDATAAMISAYVKQVHESGSFVPSLLARPRVVIGIPSSVTEVQRRAVWEAALQAGAREAFLIEEPMAAALGGNISVFQSKGVMVVDIGGGTTEMAVISLGGIVVGKSLKVAGDEMDAAILHYIRLKHGMLLGEPTGEELKIRIGSAYAKAKSKSIRRAQDLFEPEPQSRRPEFIEGERRVKSKDEDEKKSEKEKDKMMIVRGRDIETGLPRTLRVTEAEVREALSPVVTQIVEAVADVVEEAPPELIADILEHGIFLTGGGANLEGLDLLIAERTKMPVVVSDDPLTTVVRGTGKVLEDDTILSRVKVTGGLK